MLLDTGTKLLICHRRLFSEDQPRFFAGVVEASEGGLAKVSGFSWTRDPSQGFVRKDDRRSKIVSLVSGTMFVYELPRELLIEDLHVEQTGGHTVVMTDGRKFRIDLSERHGRAG